jgi:hypothetical protein
MKEFLTICEKAWQQRNLLDLAKRMLEEGEDF